MPLVVVLSTDMIEHEEILVRSAQRGDRAAFEELVRRVSRLVLASLYLETGDTHHAEDLLQETLLTAFRSLDQLQEPGKFRPWLLRIAHNQAIDAAPGTPAKAQMGPDVQIGLSGLHAIPAPEEEAERGELRQQVLAVLRAVAGGISPTLDVAVPRGGGLRIHPNPDGTDERVPARPVTPRHEDAPRRVGARAGGNVSSALNSCLELGGWGMGGTP